MNLSSNRTRNNTMKSKIYTTPKGIVIAKSIEQAAAKKGVPAESVYVTRNGVHTGIPPRCAQYY